MGIMPTYHPCSICGEPVNIWDLMWREFDVREHNFRMRGELIIAPDFAEAHPVTGAWHSDCAVVEFGEDGVGNAAEIDPRFRAVQFKRCQRPGCCVPRKL